MRKNRKRSLAFGLIVLLFLSFATALVLNLPKNAKAEWWDDSFGYRHRVSFTHNAALSNQSVTFTLDTAELITAGLMQADCDDTRFTDANGSLLLFDLTGTCDNASTTYEVIFPTIVNGSNLFYVYYGSPTAANAEIDSTGYTALTPSGGDPSLTNPTSSGNQEKSQGPVAYWSFDEGYGTTAQDGSGNNYDGTITGAAWQTENMCVSEKCLWFDGSNDFIDTADIPSLYGSSSMTISLWFKQNLASALKALITKADFQTQDAWALQTDDTDADELQFYVFNHISTDGGTNSMSTTNANLSDGIWYHLVVVYDGTQSNSDRVKFYLNGRQLSTSGEGTIPTTLTSATSTVKIGQWGGTLTRNFNGFLDEVKIYSHAKTAAQAQADYNSKSSSKGVSAALGTNPQNNPAALTNLLTGYWSLDEATANTCTGATNDSCDKSTYGNDGAWNGNATSATGKFGNGVVFDGTGDYINLGQNSTIKTGDAQGNLTIAAWVKFNSDYTSTQTILSNTQSGGASGNYMLEFGRTDNKFTFVSDDNVDATSVGTISDNNWHHVVFTRLVNGSNRTLSFYIDGVFDSATDTTANSGGGGNTSIGRAGDFDGNYFNGTIDEVRFYKRTLSNADVSALYAFAPEPVGYWKLDENSGTTISDSGGNGLGGTINGNPIWATGKYGSSLNMDGTVDSVTITDNASLDLTRTKDYTWSYWIRPDGFTEWRSTWIQVQEAVGYVQVYAHTTSDTFWGPVTAGISACWVNDANTTYTCRHTTNNVLSLGTWAHVSVVYDSSQAQASRFRIYINGVDRTDTSDSQSTGTLPNISSTTTAFGEGNGDPDFDGSMDDVKFYNYARTSSQIVQDMNAGHPTGGSPISSVLAYYPFDEGADNNCLGGSNDVCNMGYGGTDLDGSQANMAVPATSTSGRTLSGKINGALLFDGTDDNVDLGTSSAFDLTTFTISAWIKWTGTEGSFADYIVSDHEATGTYVNYRLLRTSSTNKLTGSVCFTDNTCLDIDSPDDYTSTDWSHVALTFDGTTLGLWINGKEVVTGATTKTPRTNNGNVKIGMPGSYPASSGDYFFHGTIDEVKFYSSALTQDQIAIDMNGNSGIALGGVLGTQDNEGFGGNPPVAWWKLDEKTGSTGFDYSGNGYNLTAIGGPSWVSGKTGAAINLDGDSQYLRTSAAHGQALFGGQTELTTSFWYFVRDTSTYKMVLEYDQGNSGWSLESDAATLDFYVNNGVPINTTTLAIGKWYHIALLIDGTNQQVYVNGVLADSASFSDPISDVSSVFSIGARDSDTSLHTDGIIDDFKIYDYARSPAQIAWDYNRGAPVAHWEFDECQGPTAYDTAPKPNKSDSGHNGTIIPGSGTPPENTAVGSCNSGNNYEMWNDGTTGKFNASLGFDGNDDYVEVSDNAALRPENGSWSVSVWANPANTNQYSPLVAKDSQAGPGYEEWALYICGAVDCGSTGKKLYATFLESLGTTTRKAISSSDVTDGNWHHFVMVADKTADEIKLYSDGKQLSTTTFSDGSWPTINNTTTLRIGSDHSSPANLYTNQIDDVRIYNYALSATQIKNIYNNGAVFFGPEEGSP